MNADDAIRLRRSVRRYTDRPVPDAVVDECLRLALLAPTGGMAQAWSFIVVRDPETRAQLAEIVIDGGAQYFAAARPPADGVTPRKHALWAANYADEVLGSYTSVPVWIVAVRVPRNALPATHAEEERTSDVISLAFAMENLFIAARARGIGTVPTVFHWFRDEAFRDLLGLPPNLDVPVITPFGYPEEFPDSLPPALRSKRRPWRTLVFDDRWNQPHARAAKEDGPKASERAASTAPDPARPPASSAKGPTKPGPAAGQGTAARVRGATSAASAPSPAAGDDPPRTGGPSADASRPTGHRAPAPSPGARADTATARPGPGATPTPAGAPPIARPGSAAPDPESTPAPPPAAAPDEHGPGTDVATPSAPSSPSGSARAASVDDAARDGSGSSTSTALPVEGGAGSRPPAPLSAAEVLRAARTELGLSRIEIAEIVGTTPRLIDEWIEEVSEPGRHLTEQVEALRGVVTAMREQMTTRAARVWMSIPSPELDYYSPVDVLRRGELYLVERTLRERPRDISLGMVLRVDHDEDTEDGAT